MERFQPKTTKSYYNPAFSQQSEFYNGQPISHLVNNHQGMANSVPAMTRIRQSPLGGQTQFYESEQDFYEEMFVDDEGYVKEKNVLVVSSPSSNKQTRYELIPMQPSSRKNPQLQEVRPSAARYEYVRDREDPCSSPPPSSTTRRTGGSKAPVNMNRYEYIQCPSEPSSPSSAASNTLATQKLYELLSTPRKAASPAISSPRQDHPLRIDPFQRTSPSRRENKSRVQQKLNYALGISHHPQLAHCQAKRHTAVVAPMCSSPVQSMVYSETTLSQKTESWLNLPAPPKTTQVTLAVAALMMVMCGIVTSGLCFYMVSIMGRLYFLDFGIVAGFTCLVLGVLGFRTRNCYWLPNRNYISGYIILSVLSLLMCAGLLVLLVMQPKPGSPLADMTSGAVCGISVLSLILASVGIMTSYCCQYPPPDNRVQHNAQGFTV